MAVRSLLTCAGVTLAPPGPSDYVLLVRGVPVAPWIPLRPAAEVWAAWLRRLEDLYAEWRRGPAAALAATPAAIGRALRAGPAASQPLVTWETWRRQHVIILEAHRALTGARRLAAILEHAPIERGEVHLVGHSVGGAAVLTYLAGWRAGILPPPRMRLHAALTLDAAVTGLAGVWSGAHRSLARDAGCQLNGLGAWSAEHGIALLTAANERDIWSHRALADLPYLGLRPHPCRGLRAQMNGTIHGWLRRAPQLVEAVWSAGE